MHIIAERCHVVTRNTSHNGVSTMSQTELAFHKLSMKFERGTHSNYCENYWVVADWSTIDTYVTLTICHNEKYGDTVDNCSAFQLMLEIEDSDDSYTVELAMELCSRIDNLIEFAIDNCETIDDIRDNVTYRKMMLDDDAISYHASASENRKRGQWELYHRHCLAFDSAHECSVICDRVSDVLASFETLTIREW